MSRPVSEPRSSTYGGQPRRAAPVRYGCARGRWLRGVPVHGAALVPRPDVSRPRAVAERPRRQPRSPWRQQRSSQPHAAAGRPSTLQEGRPGSATSTPQPTPPEAAGPRRVRSVPYRPRCNLRPAMARLRPGPAPRPCPRQTRRSSVARSPAGSRTRTPAEALAPPRAGRRPRPTAPCRSAVRPTCRTAGSATALHRRDLVFRCVRAGAAGRTTSPVSTLRQRLGPDRRRHPGHVMVGRSPSISYGAHPTLGRWFVIGHPPGELFILRGNPHRPTKELSDRAERKVGQHPHTHRQCPFVEIERRLVDVELRAGTRPHTQAPHRTVDLFEIPREVLAST